MHLATQKLDDMYNYSCSYNFKKCPKELTVVIVVWCIDSRFDDER